MNEQKNTSFAGVANGAAEEMAKERRHRAEVAINEIDNALSALRRYKPNDRSEQDRYWAITITEIEKAMAIFLTYVIGQ